jgi:pyruvate,orthophosphate dikinase
MFEIDAANHVQSAHPTINFPPVRIIIPTVCTDHEVHAVATLIKTTAAECGKQFSIPVKYTLGASLEVPRACLRANAIASEGDVSFLQFETDSLTEMVYGLSKEESKKILDAYRTNNIFAYGM